MKITVNSDGNVRTITLVDILNGGGYEKKMKTLEQPEGTGHVHGNKQRYDANRNNRGCKNPVWKKWISTLSRQPHRRTYLSAARNKNDGRRNGHISDPDRTTQAKNTAGLPGTISKRRSVPGISETIGRMATGSGRVSPGLESLYCIV